MCKKVCFAENNHPAIIDRTTWSAAQAENERRGGLRTASETGNGRYSWRFAFSGMLFCGHCGSTFRRHDYVSANGTERTWICKAHEKSKKNCPQLQIKESWLESVWVKTLNGLLIDKERVRSVVAESIAGARIEAGEGDTPQSDLAAIDGAIDAAQARMRELSKDRAVRRITAEEYNTSSRSVMDELDRLFAERDETAERRGIGALDKVCGKLITDFIAEGQEQTAFDKDVFTRLVNKVTIKDRDKITFELRDGTTVKGEIDVD